ncbi:hypothetical protein HGA92_02480 [Candidatus Gracilibacteria bacterium]|nr:hypothetical protein [Candidatus Gracilibacteria bacterium]NUJ99359.1 hypothetical protein [Candidatus Gracilibacteria bacterium]
MLSEKQQKVFDILYEYIMKHGRAPTLDELQIITEQKSKRGVVQYLEALERKGFITRGDGHRSIKLGNSVGFQTTMHIPIFGFANAGRPLVEAEQTDLGVFPVSKKLIQGDGKKYFIVKIEGTSMNNFKVNGKFIENGSYVLIKKDEVSLNNKDAFLFIVDRSATVKKFKKDSQNIYLLPESKDEYHKPIVMAPDDNIIVNGKVVDVFNFE